MDISVKKAFDFDYVALMKRTWRYMHRTSIDCKNTRVAAPFADGASNGLLPLSFNRDTKLTFGFDGERFTYREQQFFLVSLLSKNRGI